MSYKNILPLTLVFFFLLSSCANYKMHIAESEADWKSETPDTNLKLTHRMYLVGDAGAATKDNPSPVLTYLEKKLAEEGKNSSIIFLGDNIYPDGMPTKNDKKERDVAQDHLDQQLATLNNFKGHPYFIPGNHDWRYGIKGLRRQEKYIEKEINKMRNIEDDDDKDWGNYFYPDQGCPGPEMIEINDELALIIIDSQWWLEDWDKEPRMHDGCEAKNRHMFKFLFENAVKKYRTKNVVIAMHHPLESHGSHGGKFTVKDHLFPLTALNKNLYVPLPFVGSLYPFIRGNTGLRQDLAHKTYKDLKGALLTGAKKNGSFIFVAGHEHNLQYNQASRQHYIVSGSGSKKSPSAAGKGSKFGYAVKGFSTIDFYEGGVAWLSFWQPNSEGTDATLLFRKKIKDKLKFGTDEMPKSFPEFENMPEVVEKRLIKDEVKSDVSGMHKWFMGTHFREEYSQTYQIPTLDLSKYKNGLTPVKRGGGNQTNSLRLLATDGKQYVMRDLTKDASRLLPYPFNKLTFVKGIALDNFLSSHPFSSIAIPTLAKSINIYHTNPKLFYVPKQPALGEYNDAYGASVYMIEERPGGNWENSGVFGETDKYLGTPDVAEKLVKNHNHKIDQPWTIRTRLFDLVLGDWDRHDDQWRWGRFKEGDKNIYRPIPRDRDQAFSKYDGVVSGIARFTVPSVRQLAIYDADIKNIKWAAYSPRHFDNSFLNELDWEGWKIAVKEIQAGLTDEVIAEAFKSWPDQINNENTAHIKKTLKARRDGLEDIAYRYYKYLSKEVDVYGTEKRELFEIHRLNDEVVNVKIFELSKKGKKKKQLYERNFKRGITKFIDIYGNGDDDIFKVTGKVASSIKVRLIGGLGKDVFEDESEVANGGKMTIVYDDLGKNEVKAGPETKDKRSRHTDNNVYDRRAYQYEYDFTIPTPLIGINPDDGLSLGASFLRTSYRFKKSPYASTQRFTGSFAFATRAFNLGYEGDFLDVFGKWDFLLQADLQGPSYSFNFFGLGNDAQADFENREIDFYRVRQSEIRVFPAFKKRYAGGSGFFAIGPLFQTSNLQATADRFISTDAGLPDGIFDQLYYGGAESQISYTNLDNILMPHHGISFNASLAYLRDLKDKSRTDLGQLKSTFILVQNLDLQQNFVFATRFGFSHNIGDNYQFFQAARLGGRESLRGYRAERFYGNTAFWQNINLRAKISKSSNRIIPFSFGVFGGFDYGRVWLGNEDSDDWKYSYGGGIWIAPVDLLAINIGIFQPKENNEDGPRFTLKVGMGL